MDKRKLNGGNSTKARPGKIDKRKNEYKQALHDAATVEDVKNVIQTVMTEAIDKKDMQAAKLFLSYYLGNPKDSIDITSGGDPVTADLSKLGTDEILMLKKIREKLDS